MPGPHLLGSNLFEINGNFLRCFGVKDSTSKEFFPGCVLGNTSWFLLNSTRAYSSHIKINENEVLITGGEDTYGLTPSTVIVKLGESRPGPTLPRTLQYYW